MATTEARGTSGECESACSGRPHGVWRWARFGAGMRRGERLRLVGLPLARFEERSVEHALEWGVGEGHRPRRFSEEAEEERDAEVGHQQRLEQHLGVGGAEVAAKLGQVAHVEYVLLALQPLAR